MFLDNVYVDIVKAKYSGETASRKASAASEIPGKGETWFWETDPKKVFFSTSKTKKSFSSQHQKPWKVILNIKKPRKVIPNIKKTTKSLVIKRKQGCSGRCCVFVSLLLEWVVWSRNSAAWVKWKDDDIFCNIPLILVRDQWNLVGSSWSPKKWPKMRTEPVLNRIMEKWPFFHFAKKWKTYSPLARQQNFKRFPALYINHLKMAYGCFWKKGTVFLWTSLSGRGWNMVRVKKCSI